MSIDNIMAACRQFTYAKNLNRAKTKTNKIMITKESVKANLKEGWRINDNEKVVNAIITRCNANNGLCPCHHPADDGDLHCPCESYRLRDKCCCNLYVKNDER